MPHITTERPSLTSANKPCRNPKVSRATPTLVSSSLGVRLRSHQTQHPVGHSKNPAMDTLEKSTKTELRCSKQHRASVNRTRRRLCAPPRHANRCYRRLGRFGIGRALATWQALYGVLSMVHVIIGCTHPRIPLAQLLNSPNS